MRGQTTSTAPFLQRFLPGIEGCSYYQTNGHQTQFDCGSAGEHYIVTKGARVSETVLGPLCLAPTPVQPYNSFTIQLYCATRQHVALFGFVKHHPHLPRAEDQITVFDRENSRAENLNQNHVFSGFLKIRDFSQA